MKFVGFCWYFGGRITCMQASFSYNTSSEILLARAAAHSHTSGEKLDKIQPCQYSENSENQSNSYSFSFNAFSRVRCMILCSFYLILTHFGFARCGLMKVGPMGPKTMELKANQVQLHQSFCLALECKPNPSSTYLPSHPDLSSSSGTVPESLPLLPAGIAQHFSVKQ